jgi:hypothetical protein
LPQGLKQLGRLLLVKILLPLEFGYQPDRLDQIVSDRMVFKKTRLKGFHWLLQDDSDFACILAFRQLGHEFFCPTPT